MPERFELRLRPLLDVRRHERDEKQRNYASRQSALDDVLRRGEQLAALLQMRTSALRKAAGAPSPLAMRLYDGHLTSLRRAMGEGAHLAAERESERRLAAAELIAANRAYRVLEKLEERHRRAAEARALRRETLELDDANACRSREPRP
ncbi:MAG: flagellar FliJ family protein [Candidatus Baltobacteraceae bacterium]